MRFEKYKESPYLRLYNTLAAWINQPSMCKKASLIEFGKISERCGQTSRTKYTKEFCNKYPEFEYYANMKFGEISFIKERNN